METSKSQVAIPERTSSIRPTDLAKELKRKRVEHQKSQASLDALIDVEYWDLELAKRQCDDDEKAMWHTSRIDDALKGKISSEDLHELERSLARKRGELKETMDHIIDQRQRLLDRMSSSLTGLAKDLRQSRDAFTLILQKAALDKFRPGPRDFGTQSTFRKVLIHEHRSINPEAEDELWCPVLGEYVDRSVMKAAHIFPYRLGEDVMKAVFGDTSANEMFSPRNGLMLYSQIERKFDDFMIVIVPAGAPDSGRWKTRILDQSIMKQTMVNKRTYGSLDDQELVFKGNARPAARYLYWHYATAVMKMADRKSTRGWLQEMSKNCWATPGKYIRQNMLIALAERIGHSVPEDGLQEHAIPEPLIPHLDDKMAAKVVMDAVEEDNSDEARFDPEFS